MKFREVKDLIYSPLLLVIGDKKLYPISVERVPELYDRFEVIGIRSLNDASTNYEDAIVVSLKEPLYATESRGDRVWHDTKDLRNTSICKNK